METPEYVSDLIAAAVWTGHLTFPCRGCGKGVTISLYSNMIGEQEERIQELTGQCDDCICKDEHEMDRHQSLSGE